MTLNRKRILFLLLIYILGVIFGIYKILNIFLKIDYFIYIFLGISFVLTLLFYVLHKVIKDTENIVISKTQAILYYNFFYIAVSVIAINLIVSIVVRINGISPDRFATSNVIMLCLAILSILINISSLVFNSYLLVIYRNKLKNDK